MKEKNVRWRTLNIYFLDILTGISYFFISLIYTIFFQLSFPLYLLDGGPFISNFDYFLSTIIKSSNREYWSLIFDKGHCIEATSVKYGDQKEPCLFYVWALEQLTIDPKFHRKSIFSDEAYLWMISMRTTNWSNPRQYQFTWDPRLCCVFRKMHCLVCIIKRWFHRSIFFFFFWDDAIPPSSWHIGVSSQAILGNGHFTWR